MTVESYRTVVDYIPQELSQKSADWYAKEHQNCPQWSKYSVTLICNAIAIFLTPLAMICDLIAALIFKVQSFCSGSRSEEISNKSWEFLKSGSVGGLLFICLAFIRIFSPGHSALITPEETTEQPESPTSPPQAPQPTQTSAQNVQSPPQQGSPTPQPGSATSPPILQTPQTPMIAT